MNSSEHLPDPVVTIYGVLDMQVCVPDNYTDAQITAYANVANPCGTTGGWRIRKEGHPLLDECRERIPCEERLGCVHVMLDA